MSENTNETNVTKTTNSQSATDLQQVIISKSIERKKKIPLFIGIAAILVIGIIVTLSLTAFGGGSKTKKALAQLDLGNKYLDELDYEQAEAAFVAALQINPKNTDAYLGLIDVYAQNGDAEKLAKVYKDASKEFTGSAATDEAELKRVQEKAAQAIEKLIQEALSAGDYEKAQKLAEYLAKVDSERADEIKAQIAEAKMEAERKAALAKELEGVGIGEVITFGHYEQDNDTSNGAEPIDWVVLTKEADRMLVISRYAMDCQPYNTEWKEVTWDVCTLRSWLNDSFYNTAFNGDEKSKIVTVTKNNPDSYAFFNSEYAIDHYVRQWGYDETDVRSRGADGGNATSDNVFCLSYEEALAYFATDEARRCTPTAYATAQGAYSPEYDSTVRCYWWLRSPVKPQYGAMEVYIDGSLCNFLVDIGYFAVRPAMWISVN